MIVFTSSKKSLKVYFFKVVLSLPNFWTSEESKNYLYRYVLTEPFSLKNFSISSFTNLGLKIELSYRNKATWLDNF